MRLALPLFHENNMPFGIQRHNCCANSMALRFTALGLVVAFRFAFCVVFCFDVFDFSNTYKHKKLKNEFDGTQQKSAVVRDSLKLRPRNSIPSRNGSVFFVVFMWCHCCALHGVWWVTWSNGTRVWNSLSYDNRTLPLYNWLHFTTRKEPQRLQWARCIKTWARTKPSCKRKICSFQFST